MFLEPWLFIQLHLRLLYPPAFAAAFPDHYTAAFLGCISFPKNVCFPGIEL